MRKCYKKVSLILGLIIYMFGLYGGLGFAATSIAKGYTTEDSELKTGMVASLISGSGSSVERTSYTNSDSLIGVAIRVDDSTVTVSSKSDTVYVADAGVVRVFVSDINGSPKKGDLLVVSPLKGILMKKTEGISDEIIVAAASNDFGQGEFSEQKVSSSEGDKTVRVEQLDAELRRNQVDTKSQSKSAVEEFVFAITGKQTSFIRIIAAIILLFIILIVEGSIVYGAVSSSITAVGRNPLSRKSVYKQLAQTGVLSLMILLFGAVGIYVVIYT